MMEVRQLVYHIHQIFKEARKTWGIAFACSLPKSFHHAKSVKLSSEKSTNHLSSMILKDINLTILIKLNLSLVVRSMTRKKQNP